MRAGEPPSGAGNGRLDPRHHARQRCASRCANSSSIARSYFGAQRRRRGSSGSRRRASARRRRCSAWTARGRRPGAGAGGPSSGRWRPTRRRCARRRAGRPSRRRSRGRSARRARPRARPRRRPRRRPPGQRVGELVEEQPPQRARIARVAGEQRALDRLRQVDQREDRPVEVRDVRRQARALGLGEGLDGVVHGRADSVATADRRRTRLSTTDAGDLLCIANLPETRSTVVALSDGSPEHMTSTHTPDRRSPPPPARPRGGRLRRRLGQQDRRRDRGLAAAARADALARRLLDAAGRLRRDHPRVPEDRRPARASVQDVLRRLGRPEPRRRGRPEGRRRLVLARARHRRASSRPASSPPTGRGTPTRASSRPRSSRSSCARATRRTSRPGTTCSSPASRSLTPNPFTSGAAKWNLLAAYGQARTPARTRRPGWPTSSKLIKDHVKVQDKSGREALQTFTSRHRRRPALLRERGDHRAEEGPGRRLRHPGRHDPDREPDRRDRPRRRPQAQAFLDYVLSKPAQETFAELGLPPGQRDGAGGQHRRSSRRRPGCSRSTTSAAGRRSTTSSSTRRRARSPRSRRTRGSRPRSERARTLAAAPAPVAAARAARRPAPGRSASASRRCG